MVKVTTTFWYSTPHGVIGIVLTEDGKFFIGRGLGNNEHADACYIVDCGVEISGHAVSVMAKHAGIEPGTSY